VDMEMQQTLLVEQVVQVAVAADLIMAAVEQVVAAMLVHIHQQKVTLAETDTQQVVAVEQVVAQALLVQTQLEVL
jgi:hypothetical protein